LFSAEDVSDEFEERYDVWVEELSVCGREPTSLPYRLASFRRTARVSGRRQAWVATIRHAARNVGLRVRALRSRVASVRRS
jgi:hypothetical protein